MAEQEPSSESTELSPLDRSILELIEPRAKVLDLGCGRGRLLKALEVEKQVQGQGIEISEDAIYSCVEKGLNVYHGDIDTGLAEYPDTAFDYVILNQSLQEVQQVDYVFGEALRVGRKVIVAFPNFAHLSARVHLFFRGRAPVTKSLPYSWNDTPSLRFLSLCDFKDYCRAQGVPILRSTYLKGRCPTKFFPNILATHAIFVITRKSPLLSTQQLPSL